jgi:tRNA (Thr-GGU) A37 N-methylase
VWSSRRSEAWIVLEPAFVDGLDGIEAGSRVIVLTWLHRAERDGTPVVDLKPVL